MQKNKLLRLFQPLKDEHTAEPQDFVNYANSVLLENGVTSYVAVLKDKKPKNVVVKDGPWVFFEKVCE